jgi:hypothetical protein
LNGTNFYNNGGSLGVGTVSPDPSSNLELSSTTQGFLPPRMTTAQRDAIQNPVNGLMIFNLSSGCPNYYSNNQWFEWCGTGVGQSGNTGALILQYPSNSIFCTSGPTVIVDVTNPTTGKIWMDRNLGASQVATSSTDAAAYGDLYQWGRRSDGHQCRTSATTTTLSSTDQPANGNFIIVYTGISDWRSPQNVNLWQGVNGVNNPCPSGYRIPTETEINAERLSWSQNNSLGAFASPLKLPKAGLRIDGGGSIYYVGSDGFYWSSTVGITSSRNLTFSSSDAAMAHYGRAIGSAIRCLKD